MVNKNVIAVLDGAAGSCGKGKVIGQLVLKEDEKILASVANCSPNAGHTVMFDDRTKFIFRNIPSACVNKDVALFIGPGSEIDMDIFIQEYESVKHLIGDRKIYVHELVPLIEEKHKERERRKIKSGSTNHGCGACLQDKILRDPDLKFFKGYKNAIVLDNDTWADLLYTYLDDKSGYVLLEGSQGADLSLETSGNHPYVTKENISTANLINHSMIPTSRVLDTILVIRPFPIRISNESTTNKYIYTGGYGKGAPLFWSEINYSATNGTYPYPGILEDYYGGTIVDLSYIKALMSEVKESDLIDIFGFDYKHYNLENANITKLIELERRALTENGVYYSKIMNEPIIDLAERTTVTKKERRVFDIDIKKLQNNVRNNDAKTIYLNFFQHLNLAYEKEKDKYGNYWFDRYLENYLDWLEGAIKKVSPDGEIACLGTGECISDFIRKRSLILK